MSEPQGIVATIHAEGTSYSSDYAAKYVLYNEADEKGRWLGPDGATSYFVLALQSVTTSNRGGFDLSCQYNSNHSLSLLCIFSRLDY